MAGGRWKAQGVGNGEFGYWVLLGFRVLGLGFWVLGSVRVLLGLF